MAPTDLTAKRPSCPIKMSMPREKLGVKHSGVTAFNDVMYYYTMTAPVKDDVLVNMFCQHLPFKKSTIDVVSNIFAFDHVEDPRGAGVEGK